MSPAALAMTMVALGGSRAVAPAAALPVAATALAPSLAAALPAPDASTIVPTPASPGLSGSVLHPPMQASHQAGAAPWAELIAEMGIGRAGLQAEALQPDASGGPDAHGWNAIVADLNAQAGTGQPDAPQPVASGAYGEAADWTDVVAEAGLGREAQPAANSFTDDGWAALAAEAAAERRTKHQD